MTKKYDVNEQVTRLCRCGETDLSEFYKNKSARGGLSYACKECEKAYAKRYRKTENSKMVKKRFMKNIGGNKGFYSRYKNAIRRAQKKYESKDSSKIKHRVRESRRRKKINNVDGDFTSKQWESLKQFYSPNNKCMCCGEIKDILEIDHVVPIFLGGTNFITNLQPLCGSCNSSKRIKIVDYRFDNGLYAFRLLG